MLILGWSVKPNIHFISNNFFLNCDLSDCTDSKFYYLLRRADMAAWCVREQRTQLSGLVQSAARAERPSVARVARASRARAAPAGARGPDARAARVARWARRVRAGRRLGGGVARLAVAHARLARHSRVLVCARLRAQRGRPALRQRERMRAAQRQLLAQVHWPARCAPRRAAPLARQSSHAMEYSILYQYASKPKPSPALGTSECSCATGYQLDPSDRRTCRATDTSHVFLLALQANELKELRLYRVPPHIARGASRSVEHCTLLSYRLLTTGYCIEQIVVVTTHITMITSTVLHRLVCAEAKAAVNMELSPLQLLDPKTVAPLGDTGIDMRIRVYKYN